MSIDASYRVFQNISLPLKNARLTPALRAASTLARCCPDQYSSWPTERKACGRLALVKPIDPFAPSGVDAGPVLDVVAVGFEPADHRVLGVEQPAGRVVRACVERAVVADPRG